VQDLIGRRMANFLVVRITGVVLAAANYFPIDGNPARPGVADGMVFPSRHTMALPVTAGNSARGSAVAQRGPGRALSYLAHWLALIQPRLPDTRWMPLPAPYAS